MLAVSIQFLAFKFDQVSPVTHIHFMFQFTVNGRTGLHGQLALRRVASP